MTVSPNGEGEGRLVRVCQGLPPVEVDASGWEPDIPAEAWSSGKFSSPVQHLPAIEVDFSHVESQPRVWLELVVSFAPDAPPAAIVGSAIQMVSAVQAIDPGLSLRYEASRSRADGANVVIALAPSASEASEGRLRQVLADAQAKLSQIAGAERAVARLGRAA